MRMDTVTFKTIKGISFGVYSSEEILKLSVLEISNIEILDCLGNSTTGGLYDIRLGPNDRDDVCGTCGLDYMRCAGHPGHINLPIPVFNPVFFQHLYQLLRGSCFSCYRLLAPPVALHLTLYQLQALDHGLVSTVQDLAEVVTDSEDGSFCVIEMKLQKKYNEALQASDPEVKNYPVKSVVECRRNIVRNFVKNYMMGAKGKCPHCHTAIRKLTRYNMRIVYTDNKKVPANTANIVGNNTSEETYSQGPPSNKELTPQEARKDLHMLWENNKIFLQHLFKTLCRKEECDSVPIDMFFMDRIIVPPSKFRRLNVMKGKKYADVQTIAFNEVQKDCVNIIKLLRKFGNLELSPSDMEIISKLQGKTDSEKFNNAYHMLQRHVHEIFDSDINKDRTKTSKGIKQVLEKKEGLFRMHMMGKRVNFAARSVISPDPCIMVNEIGIPMVFAKKLTFPEPVNYWNIENLRRAVVNGPNVHPGATMVEMEDGRKIKLAADDLGRRLAVAKTLLTPPTLAVKKVGAVKVVHRHVKNGDMLLLNRQPTLHKPSIMAHKARVLPGEKTLRLHYANCKSYNADFDGDEMNAHLPQSYMGQGECRHIVGVNHQYLVPKDGTPLSGLIQDHIIAGVMLTIRGRFFDRQVYHQLISGAMPFHHKRLKMLPPSILKPRVLWSGKQVVSTIIINLLPKGKVPPTVEGKAKVSSKNWIKEPARKWRAGGTPLVNDAMSESEVIIRNGELLCGVIDKAHVGPTPYSLIHICYELYGGETSSVILTALARLFTHYLQHFTGYSLGIEDIVVNQEPNEERKRILSTGKHKGRIATAKALNVDNPETPKQKELLFQYKETHLNRDDSGGLAMLDMEMKNVTLSLNDDISKVCIPSGLRKKFPQNNLQLMIESGAKGSSVNAMQISCLLGQIELEGRRMPLMLNGSTLPSFQPYDTSPQAGGFVGGRFLSGINSQEYFFHCMAGREGLIDTAVKTSRSGYLQRCLIKHLEGITVNYDLTVRDADGTVIQFLYGEDGMDPSKMQLLKENRLHILGNNYKSAINESEVQNLKTQLDVDLNKEKKKIKKWRKKHLQSSRIRLSCIDSIETKNGAVDLKQRQQEIMQQILLLEDENKKYNVKTKKCPDPVVVKHRPDVTFGAVCEKMDSLISDYVSKNPHQLLWEEESRNKHSISSQQFKDVCYYRALRSLAEPGETVGLLAAQSIGEPSTQMTLNTFHFAGKGEMNVTLGIPRIREILMTASANIATPTMDLPFLDKPGIEEEAERLALKLSPSALKDVLDSVKIKEFISIPNNLMNTRNYVIRMKFLKHSKYREFVDTTPSKILNYIEKIFIKKLIDALKKKRNKSATAKVIDIVKESSSFMKGEMNNEDEDAPPTDEPPVKQDDGESSAESEDEGDTTSTKSKMRHNQDQSYEEPEDEEWIPESDSESDDKEVVKQEAKSEDENEDPSKFDEYKEMKDIKISITDAEKGMRINNVKCLHGWISNYDFDSSSQLWCEISLQLQLDSNKIDMKSLLEEEINKANIFCVPQIKKAILVKRKKNDDKLMIKTDGVNFLEIFKYIDVLDVNKVYSNNIHEIANIYGIEAAAKAIRKEIVNVFAAYGIQVDPRHLSLVSDYMTCSGQYRPCNRLGMEGNASPLQQMTFETTKTFMVESMLMGVEERIQSPSANVVVGQLARMGTGCFDLICKSGH